MIRTVTAILANGSGGNLNKGDVVIVDAVMGLAFTTTTTVGFADGVIGVLLENIDDEEMGKVATGGYVPQINLSSAASLGDFIKTHSVAGQGVPHATPRIEGDFAQALGTGTTPPAILFGSPTPELGSVLNDYILIEDEKASGTEGGASTSGSWQTRTLNTEVHDNGNHATLASNQITLAAGTYRFSIMATSFRSAHHRAKLYDVTNAVDVKLGTNQWSDSGADDANGFSVVKGQFTIASPTVFEVRSRVSVSRSPNGYGTASALGVEIYTIAEFWKVG